MSAFVFASTLGRGIKIFHSPFVKSVGPVPHAYPRRCEAFNPKPVARTVGESELQTAWVNLERLWRGLDDQRIAEFRELLRRYLEGEFTQSEWAGVVHSIIDWRCDVATG